jgi:hypothetical protein
MPRTRDLLHRNEPAVTVNPVYRGERVRVEFPVRKPPRRLDPPEPVGVPVGPRPPAPAGASSIPSPDQPGDPPLTRGRRRDAGGEG